MRLFTMRVSEEEVQRFRRAKERLQARADPKYPVTDRTTFLEALERLEAYLDKLDKDRERAR